LFLLSVFWKKKAARPEVRAVCLIKS